MSNISLTASMRSNLLSLQNTQKLMDQTQERLSTGNKVNSAIDNPSSYYTAQSLNNRASDLSSLLDSMGQAIQTIKAADEGIKSITEFAEQAKAVAQSASDTADATEVENYMNQFAEIRKQITAVANDSGYKGVNLLNAGNSLTVKFSDNVGSSLTIGGEDATAEGLNVADVAKADKSNAWVKEVTVKDKASVTNVAVGDLVKDGDVIYQVTALKSADDKTYANATKVATNLASDTTSAKVVDSEKITTALESVSNAITTLRTMSSKFGNNYSIVQSREAFTENLINVLTEGADKLTLADMNEESANMLALQTRQQLAINSLSLASQAAQSVLKLF
ncbi:MAG: flagellin [Alphaproteobacteria bacterium]|nr:flagellin [Alphaproteobacteria bacterium]